MNINLEKFKKNSKEKKFKELLNTFEKTTDGLGLGIESGIIEQVTYLNLLGYFTTASCEGHLNNRANPYGYIHFGTKVQAQEYSNPDSIYWKTFNDARNETLRKEKEKFLIFDGTSETYTPEIDDFFNTTLSEELKKQPGYSEYLRIIEEEVREYNQEKERVGLLVNNFKKEFPESAGDISVNEKIGCPNIYFTAEQNLSKKIISRDKIELKRKSDEAANLFKRFLRKIYLNQ